MRGLLRTGLRFTAPPVVAPTVLDDRNIAWILPLLNADGSPLTDLIGIEVWRHTTTSGITDYATLQAAATLLTDPYVDPAALVYRDESAATATLYQYWLVALDSEFTPSDILLQIPRQYTV